ncbi:MAG: hypothetical protein JNM34_12560, partial [Chthonomonadaceae bacterium]|nr:hypothetical protein [Chthonomonadaceae bacterium]
MKEETGTLVGVIERVLAQELGDRAEMPEGAIEHLARECLLDGAGMLKNTLNKRRKAMLRDQARCRRAFERRLRKRWKEPFELFETCLVIAQEMGSEFNANHRPAAATSNDLVFEVMTRLHGRACHLASEVLHLMTGGYASGALTRWRALHEVVVVMLFVDL